MLHILEKPKETPIPCIINNDCDTYSILIVFPLFLFFHAVFLTLVCVIIKMCEMSLLITLVICYVDHVALYYSMVITISRGTASSQRQNETKCQSLLVARESFVFSFLLLFFWFTFNR